MAETAYVEGPGFLDPWIGVQEFSSFKAGEIIKDERKNLQDFAETMKDEAMGALQDLREEGDKGIDVSIDSGLFNDLPPTPSLGDITIPSAPDVNFPSVSLDPPSVDSITPPSPVDIPADASVDEEVMRRLRDEFYNELEEFGGYAPPIERAIYDRARTRREADLKQKKDDAASQLAKRGFPAPPGTLNAVQRRYDVEDHREETDQNRDIVQQQAELDRRKWETLMTVGQNLNNYFLQKAQFQAQTGIDKARYQMQFALDIFSSKLRKGEVQSTIMQNEVQAYAEKARMEALKLDAYRTTIQGKQAQASVKQSEAQIYSSLVDAQARQATSKADIQVKRADIKLRELDHSRQIADSMATLTSQVAASAMTAINISTQLSGSEQESRSMSARVSASRQDGVMHDYSASLSA